MFEESPMYNFIKNSGYPWINRINRENYYKPQQHLIDYSLISRRVTIFATVGYIIGQKFFTRGPTFFFMFGSAVLLWQVAVDLKLRREGKYQQIYVHSQEQEESKEIRQKQQKKQKKEIQIIERRENKFKMKPLRNYEALTAQKLIDNLPKQYFI